MDAGRGLARDTPPVQTSRWENAAVGALLWAVGGVFLAALYTVGRWVARLVRAFPR